MNRLKECSEKIERIKRISLELNRFGRINSEDIPEIVEVLDFMVRTMEDHEKLLRAKDARRKDL